MVRRGLVVSAGMMLLACLGLMSGCTLPAGEQDTPSTTSTLPYATTTTTESPTSSSTSTSTAATTTSTTTKRTSTTVPAVVVPEGGKELVTLPTRDKVVALTFDAAYDPEPLAAILAALKKANAKATFFLTGEFVRDFPDSVLAIKAAGHAIGNHSWSHPDFLEVSDDEIRSQLRRTAAALTKLGVADPRPLFRFPYGSRNKAALRVVGSEGYLSYFWTIDTIDWKEDRTPEQVRASILDKLQPGAIVLMHVGSRQTASVLPQILDDLAERGYKTVGLREALQTYGF